jgi:CheY-like chemotaxis protein
VGKFSVLLVDDDSNTQTFFQDVLDHFDLPLWVANDMQSTLSILAQHSPDVIVLDIFLPDTDGYKLLHLLRTQGITCPVVAITGYYTTDTMAEIHRKGFNGCLLKPLDAQELVNYLIKITQH